MEIKGLRDALTEKIREQIITGRLYAGHRLNEAELCEMFNVSRSPLREALLILEREDLVIRKPRKGTYVSPMSEEDARMIYQVMEMVEIYAIDHLEKEGITQVPELRSAVDKCTFHISKEDGWEDLLKYRSLLAGFHARLVETLKNPLTIAFYKRTSSNLARYQYLQLLETGSGKGMIGDHKRIITYIEKGAYQDAREELKVHIRKSFQYKINALNEHYKRKAVEKG
jgi:DNA-binding GntR family transcriptional regulator